MKKKLSLVSFALLFILLLSMLLPVSNSFSFALTQGAEAKVIVSRCYLYADSSFSAEIVTYEEGENTLQVILHYGDEIEVKGFKEDFVLVSTNGEIEGYIYKYYLTDNTSQIVYPVFNASLRKTSVLYDIEQKPTEYKIKKGSRVYIYEGFKDKEKRTAVQVVLEDGSLYNGYISTANINPDGVSGLLIIAISIIIAGVTIVLSIIFIKKKKKSQKAKNKEYTFN